MRKPIHDFNLGSSRRTDRMTLRKPQDVLIKNKTLKTLIRQSNRFLDGETYTLNLQKADLIRVDLTWEVLTNADLRYANLTGASLDYTRLQGARMNGANLSEASFLGAHLFRVDFRDARLAGAKFDKSLTVLRYLASEGDLPPGKAKRRLMLENPLLWGIPRMYELDITYIRALAENPKTITREQIWLCHMCCDPKYLFQHYFWAFRDTRDMAKQLNQPFNPRWSPTRMREEHDRLAKELNAQNHSSEPFTALEWAPIYIRGPWGEANLLNSPLAMAQEGHQMRHCLASYIPRAESGSYLVFAIRLTCGERLTIGFRRKMVHGSWLWQYDQIQGEGNEGPQNIQIAKTATAAILLTLNQRPLTCGHS